MIKGSCLCGSIRFEINAKPDSVSHCHCKMCQKQHGAAYATYARINRSDIRYLTSEEQLTVYNSSDDILRKFCRKCGSNVEWGRSKNNPTKVGIAIGLFDSDFHAHSIKDICIESKERWLVD